jgi:hypothetical protein
MTEFNLKRRHGRKVSGGKDHPMTSEVKAYFETIFEDKAA